MKSVRILTLVACVSLPSLGFAQTPVTKPAQLPPDSVEIGRRYTSFLYDGKVDSLVAHMRPEDRTEQTKTEVAGNVATLVSRAGQEKKLLREEFYTRNGARQYWRTAEFTATPQPILVRFIIAANGELRGIGLGAAISAPPTDP